MRDISICKAQGFREKPIESVTISFVDEVPNCKTLQDAHDIYDADGKALCEILFSVLPGGTVDRLMAAMLLKKATSFKVPLFDR